MSLQNKYLKYYIEIAPLMYDGADLDFGDSEDQLRVLTVVHHEEFQWIGCLANDCITATAVGNKSGGSHVIYTFILRC